MIVSEISSDGKHEVASNADVSKNISFLPQQ